MKNISFLFLIPLLFLPPLQGVSYTTQPNESASNDTLLSQNNPTMNLGSYQYCNAGEQDNDADLSRCLMKFDLSGLPSGAQVVSAELHLTQSSENSASDTVVQVHRVTQSWSETGVTWSTAGGYEASPVGSVQLSATEPNGEKVIPLDVSSAPYGWIIRTQNEHDDLYRFWSSAAPIESNRPKLVVYYVQGDTPTPTSTPTETPSPTATFTPTPTPTFTPYVLPSNFVIPQAHQGSLHIYIIMGQSNASGRGTGTPCLEPAQLIYNFGNNYKWSVLCEPSDNSAGQVDVESIDTAGYSFASSFAVAMKQDHPDWAIGIINCSKGSTPIKQWARSRAEDTLYGGCLKRARTASLMGTIDGVLFFQGESDALTSYDANMWSGRFEQFINSIRYDYGDIPIVFAQIATKPNAQFIYWDTVKAQQASVSLPCVSMIKTDDLPQVPPHFTTAGYVAIGERMAGNLTSCE